MISGDVADNGYEGFKFEKENRPDDTRVQSTRVGSN